MAGGAEILPFSLARRWIVTVESEREMVKVRHRRRWYAVARRVGEEERRHLCQTRGDALQLAEWMREGFERIEFAEQVQAMLNRLPPIQREKAMSKLWAIASESEQSGTPQ